MSGGLIFVIEIIGLITLCSILGSILRKKGRGGGFVWLGPVLYLLGYFAGLVVEGFVAGMNNVEVNMDVESVYGIAGEVIGALLSIGIVAALPAKSLMCPSCGGGFIPSPGSKTPTFCPHCQTELQVSGKMVYETGKPPDTEDN